MLEIKLGNSCEYGVKNAFSLEGISAHIEKLTIKKSVDSETEMIEKRERMWKGDAHIYVFLPIIRYINSGSSH